MQTWQIKALELEASVLKHFDGFIHEHALYVLIGTIYLLLALLAWVLSGALRRKGGNFPFPSCCDFHSPAGTLPPAPGEQFDPFPALRDPPDYHYDCDDFDWD